MQCPDCGYIMGALDKHCLRCKAQEDKSSGNPYVAFQNQQRPPTDVPPVFSLTATETEAAQPPDLEAGMGLDLPRFARPKRPQIFLKALAAAILALMIYHIAVVVDMQDRINGLEKLTQDQQRQIDSLRDTVNYNANAANSSHF